MRALRKHEISVEGLQGLYPCSFLFLVGRSAMPQHTGGAGASVIRRTNQLEQ